jgi:hypothetical protein
MHLRRPGPTLAAVALLILVTGCSNPSGAVGSEATTTPSTPSPSSASPSGGARSSGSPSAQTTDPPTAYELAARAAVRLVKHYYRARNELRKDPNKPLGLLRSVSTSTDLVAQESFLRSQRREGYRQVGDTRLLQIEVQSVDLDNSNPKAGRVPNVVVDVCYDVSDVDILDAKGRSVVPESRPDRGWVRHSVANYEWKADRFGAWRVASSETLEDHPCAGS